MKYVGWNAKWTSSLLRINHSNDIFDFDFSAIKECECLFRWIVQIIGEGFVATVFALLQDVFSNRCIIFVERVGNVFRICEGFSFVDDACGLGIILGFDVDYFFDSFPNLLQVGSVLRKILIVVIFFTLPGGAGQLVLLGFVFI